MQASDFHLDRQTYLAPTISGCCAFVPPPLPPDLPWSQDLVTTLSAADRALGRLHGKADELPNPHLLIGPFVRREAVLSSRIEGTQAGLKDLYLFETEPGASEIPDALEVANYVRALEYGLERGKTLPVCVRLIRELHERLMHNVRGGDRSPGEFRTQQNYIGPSGYSVREATYVPPPLEQMTAALGELEKFLNAPSDLPPLVRLALIHYQFEAIHPFADGNGRIGRLLITLLMCLEGLLSEPLLYLSAYFEENRSEYYRRLLEVSTQGRWLEWLKFFLAGVVQQAIDAFERARRLQALREELRSKFSSVRASALLLRLVDELFSAPVITVKAARRMLGASDRAARQNVMKLVRGGVLTEITGKRRNQVFAAEPIIRAIEEPYRIDG